MTVVELETRNCESCGRTYKVLVSSLQKYCSSICNKEVGLKWGGQRTKPKSEERKIESVNVESIGTKKPKDPVAHLLAKHSYFPSERKRAPPIADDMLRTERKRTQDEPSTQEKTESPTMQKQDDSIKAIQTALQNNVHVGIIESPKKRKKVKKYKVLFIDIYDEWQLSSSYYETVEKFDMHNIYKVKMLLEQTMVEDDE